ncbi:hypothetical protein ACS0TY_015002 [Phlomoides rotata]
MAPLKIWIAARATTGPSPLRIRIASAAFEQQPLKIKIAKATIGREAMDSKSMNIINRSMSKNSQSSSSKDMDEDSLYSPTNEKNNLACSILHSSPALSAASAMVTNTATFEEQNEQMPMEEDAMLEKLNISSDGFVPIDQIKKIVLGTIKDKLGESTKSSLTYAKPYTKRIDNLKIPTGY